MSSTDKSKLDGIASGATNTPLTASAPANVTKATAAVGVATDAARADHKHDINTASAAANPPGSTSTEGSSTSLARADHTHALVSFGTGSGTFVKEMILDYLMQELQQHMPLRIRMVVVMRFLLLDYQDN
ncbi:MAG: hypothetical protein HC877_23630 [Thioploca sp.]|nr:hypothetical protein [Thioploca sp.]